VLVFLVPNQDKNVFLLDSYATVGDIYANATFFGLRSLSVIKSNSILPLILDPIALELDISPALGNGVVRFLFPGRSSNGEFLGGGVGSDLDPLFKGGALGSKSISSSLLGSGSGSVISSRLCLRPFPPRAARIASSRSSSRSLIR